MSLSDLAQYVPAQTDAINGLLNDPDYLKTSWPRSSPWSALKDSLWNRGMETLQEEEPVERDDNPIEDSKILPDLVPTTRLVANIPGILLNSLGLGTADQRILVRSEYVEAEQEALSAARDRRSSFVVTGQPGIGKTMCLLWLFMRRLALGLPTALQLNGSPPLLFHEHGVCQFTSPDDPSVSTLSLAFPHKIWALVDSSSFSPAPAPVFQGKSFFVVKAVRFSLLLQYLENYSPRRFFMKTWSPTELIQGRPYLLHTEQQLWNLYHKYGASPAKLVECAHDPSSYKDEVEDEVQRLSSSALLDVLETPDSHLESSNIITIGPSPTSRERFVARVASKFASELIWDRHLKHQVSESARFYDLLRSTTITSAAAGLVFESQIHRFLSQPHTATLFRVPGRSGKVNFIYDTKAQDPHDIHLNSIAEYWLEDEDDIHASGYHRPRSKNFPGFDSISVIHSPGYRPLPFAFQIMLNKEEHDVKLAGLQRIDDLSRGISWLYVVVAPEGVTPKIKVPKEYFPGEGSGIDPTDAFPVFYFPVNRKLLFPNP